MPDGNALPEIEEDIRATADDVLADVARLAEIEAEKPELAPSDPRRPALAAEAERIARRVAKKSAAQRELVDDASTEARR